MDVRRGRAMGFLKDASGVKSTLSGLRSYSDELGLNLSRPEDRFKWFIASMLFAKRISSEIAKKTYKRFEEEGLTTPKRILEVGWDRLVEVLDSGGYVRYDFSTASNLQEAVEKLLEDYGDLEGLYASSDGPRDLERRLMELKGVGPVGVNIFLRELRGVWEKADPLPSKIAEVVGNRVGVDDVRPYESALVRLKFEYCKKRLCNVCPMNEWCREVKGETNRV